MKLLVIHGSMRQGNTFALTQEILRRMAAKPDAEITEISAADLDLPFCRSCHACFAQGEEFCPHFSAMRDVRDALLACDAVILTGVTYMWSLNAAMKNLLDHLSWLFHRPALFGKRGMVIATSKGAGEKGVAKYLKTVLGQWGVNGALVLTQNEKEKQMLSAAKQAVKLDRAAEQFYRLIKSNRPSPPSLKAIAVHNAFRAMAQSEYADSARDTRYWQESGCGGKSYPVKIGWPRRVFGALVHRAAGGAARLAGRIYTKQQKGQ
jgi:multimeric flavodoxin WrbA